MSLRLPSRWKPMLMKSAIRALDSAGLFRLLAPKWQGVGVIFTLHHVQSRSPDAFSPNHLLSITPAYLEGVISQLREMNYDLVSLTEACDRLQNGKFEKRFACFTLDDGYQDNYDVALPVFQKNNVPFTVYISTSMPDGTANLWWDLLEETIKQHDVLDCEFESGSRQYSCKNVSEKYATFDAVYSSLRSMDEAGQHRFLKKLFARYQVDHQAFTRSQAMDWPTLHKLAREPLCDIGAHTLTHPRMSGLDETALRCEVEQSKERLESELDTPIEHFAYPFGDAGSAASREFTLLRTMSFRSSVTTRKGVLFPEHAEHMSALPRVSLNGNFQDKRYTRLFVEGGPFAFSNRFKRLNVN